MSSDFKILDYMSGLTGFLFDKAVLESIALERGVLEVENYTDLTERDRDLLKADMFYTAYLSPTTTASMNHSHGSYSKSDGSQTISTQDKERIYNIFMALYRKWDDPKAEEIANNVGTLQWLDIL